MRDQNTKDCNLEKGQISWVRLVHWLARLTSYLQWLPTRSVSWGPVSFCLRPTYYSEGIRMSYRIHAPVVVHLFLCPSHPTYLRSQVQARMRSLPYQCQWLYPCLSQVVPYDPEQRQNLQHPPNHCRTCNRSRRLTLVLFEKSTRTLIAGYGSGVILLSDHDRRVVKTYS